MDDIQVDKIHVDDVLVDNVLVDDVHVDNILVDKVLLDKVLYLWAGRLLERPLVGEGLAVSLSIFFLNICSFPNLKIVDREGKIKVLILNFPEIGGGMPSPKIGWVEYHLMFQASIVE